MFWALQIAGWSGFAVVQYIGSLVQEMRSIFVVIILLGAYAGFLLTIPLRYVYQRIWNSSPIILIAVVLVGSYAAAALWAVIDNATHWEIYKFGYRPRNWLFYFQHSVAKFYIILCWSGLYFVIKYYQLLQDEKQKALTATSMAHQSQLKMLRYQLNPHFLFNTLNAISTLILVNENKSANQMVSKLSEFLRFSLDNEPIKRITLDKEIDALMLYLDIEKARFTDRLNVQLDITEEARKGLVPSLLLQPLIENSIKYAVAKLEDGGNIDISAYVEAGMLNIKIEDNGPEPFSAADQKRKKREGVGLKNTEERLRALYGKQYSFTLEANQPSGCIVTISIPWQPTEKA
ncbi:sensor histidine kinase [Lysobacter sp. N42]|nr:sensor histidine kinase [Aliidiomarina sp. B3213]TCZ93436.1 sensor histidine kinase [Lysobacter sp. N42]